MKPLTLICYLLFLTGVGLLLSQMWWHVFAPEMFVKIIITDGALFVIVFIFAFLIKENRESQKINKGSGLD